MSRTLIANGRMPWPALALLLCATVLAGTAAATPKTVCTVTINSSDEKEVFQRHLPRGQYRFVELVERGRPDWFGAACRRGVSCDALIISGHFDDGTEFYTDRFDDHESLAVHELQQAACSASCSSLFAQLKEVYLFGCNTLQAAPRLVATPDIVRSLRRSGHADAERLAAQLGERYAQSNRDRLRHIFKDVPLLYGFSSKAPLGRVAGPLLERYFQSAPAGEVAGGRASPTLLKLFAPSSMIALSGLGDNEPHAALRNDVCRIADEQPSAAAKLEFVHEMLRRDAAEVRLFLDHLERYLGSLDAPRRQAPDAAAVLDAIARDQRARDSLLAFARDADEAPVQARLFALARQLGWLSAAQEQSELVQMLAARMAQDRLDRHEVELVCARPDLRDTALARALAATGAARGGRIAHAAVLACMGDSSAHETTVRALTATSDEDLAVAQVYLRHRPLADVGELRTVTSGIGRMTVAAAQVRALEALAKQRLSDATTLLEIARLFPRARSLEVQRAIAGILIRADHRQLARDELARTLRQHRLKSPDGNDVIDALIRLLSAS